MPDIHQAKGRKQLIKKGILLEHEELKINLDTKDSED